jgi:hypothetical protein
LSKTDRATIGADPELFVRKVEANPKKELVPICGLVGGTKETPLPFAGGHKGYAYQEDGVAFEFNVPPRTAANEAHLTIVYVMEKTNALLQSKGLVPEFRSWYRFKESDLKDPKAQIIGCSSDFTAYGANDEGERRVPFTAPDLGAYRFCGGHIHLGYPKQGADHIPDYVVARFLDVFVGLPTLRADQQRFRRPFYGKPGLYRPKSYGIEYRTLSNFWLRPGFNKYLPYMFDSVLQLGELIIKEEARLAEAYERIPWKDVKEAIEKDNYDQAQQVFSHIRKTVDLPLKSAEMIVRATA